MRCPQCGRDIFGNWWVCENIIRVFRYEENDKRIPVMTDSSEEE